MKKQLAAIVFPIMFLLAAILFFIFVYRPVDYQNIFGADFDSALLEFNENRELFDAVLSKYDIETIEAAAIVFPELVRYSKIKDTIEITGLKVFYIHQGNQYANFSIGLLQMKPVFAEKLESLILSVPGDLEIHAAVLKYDDMLSEKDKRRERVSRLSELSWQIEYLAAFFSFMEQRFADTNWENISDKIALYATAYNHGLDANDNELEYWQEQKVFPNGPAYDGQQYRYSDISFAFYNRYTSY